MSFEELLQEHIKALKENTKALVAYTNAVGAERPIDIEHTKESACRFCGVTHKTIQGFIADGSIIPRRRKHGKREYFNERDLVTLCESKRLYAGDYGNLLKDPRSAYYTI